MRDRIEAALERIWYGGAPVPASLAALERVYALALALRRRLYASGFIRSDSLRVPVVVVGNLTAGGTGKTPLVAWLVRELAQRGWRPGIVLRGYRGRARTARRVFPGDDPRLVGDEAVLLAHATGVPVAIGRRRIDAGRVLEDECDVVVADDGLQHWALQRDVEIAVVDGARRFGNGRLLPAGPLREPASRLSRVDHVVANGRAEPGEIPMRVRGDRAIALDDPTRTLALASLSGLRVHAIAGIGSPQRFFDLLRGYGIDVEPHVFADHHDYRGGELDLPGDGPVLMTEKDAVKAARHASPRAYAVPVEAELPTEFADRLHAQLHRARRPGDR